jgi:predicted O-methyltransferase YrrM
MASSTTLIDINGGHLTSGNHPLIPLCGSAEQFDVTGAGLTAWRQSESFQRVFAAYRNYPPQSLQSDEARALLHFLIVRRRPELVLEIGTHRAGTAEVMARALWEAGTGHLETIDPFGAETCPPLIAALPPELRDRISFHAVTSAAHFDQAIGRGVIYDLVLIDGNHELEFALFDLLCAARLMSPRGLIVLDNIEQPGPRYATRLFLKSHPQWRDIAGVVGRSDASAPFAEATPSFPDTKFYILEAPPHYAVGDTPRSFGAINSDWVDVEGIELELAAPVRGTLHVQVYLRTFGAREPEELVAQQSFRLNIGRPSDDPRQRFALNKALRGIEQRDGLQRRIEIVLAFSGKSELGLRRPPTPYPARHV